MRDKFLVALRPAIMTQAAAIAASFADPKALYSGRTRRLFNSGKLIGVIDPRQSRLSLP